MLSHAQAPLLLDGNPLSVLGQLDPSLACFPGHRRYDLGSANGMFQLETLNCVWDVGTVTGWPVHHTRSTVAMVKTAVSVVISTELACQQS